MVSEVDFECLFSATKVLSVLLLMTGNQRTQCGNPKLIGLLLAAKFQLVIAHLTRQLQLVSQIFNGSLNEVHSTSLVSHFPFHFLLQVLS